MLKGHTVARLALAFSFATLAYAQTFGIGDYGKIARVTDPHLAPDGRSVVLVVAGPNYQDDKWDSELVRVDFSTHRARELTHQRKSARFPRWSPSGDRLAFLADSAGQSQIFVFENDGDEANQITHAPTGVQAFAWKPDGSAFGYLSRDEAPKREKFDDSFEVEANDYLMQAGTQPVHLWTIASVGGEARRLTSGHWSVSGNSLAWTSAGDRIAFVSQLSSPRTQNASTLPAKRSSRTGGSSHPQSSQCQRHSSAPRLRNGRGIGLRCNHHSRSRFVFAEHFPSV
jgi:Tol biopolymer transport system component